MGLAGITRRALLGGGLGLAAGTGAARAEPPPGAVGDAALPVVLRSLIGVAVGAGPREVQVLVSPGCDHGRAMWDAAREAAGPVRVRWVPFTGTSGGSPEAVARVIEDGDAAAVAAFLSGTASARRPGAVAWAAAVRQDGTVERAVSRLLWAATGRPVAAPTAVYALADGGVRVVRGSLTAAGFAAAAAAAA